MAAICETCKQAVGPQHDWRECVPRLLERIKELEHQLFMREVAEAIMLGRDETSRWRLS